jgi:hypothetical protein
VSGRETSTAGIVRCFGSWPPLVNAHRADGKARFTRSSQHAAECPELERSEPDHGPASGGYKIELHGRNFPPVLELWWNYDETITAKWTGPGTVELIVPKAGDDEEHVYIMVSGAPRIVPAYASFDYDELASENADRD